MAKRFWSGVALCVAAFAANAAQAPQVSQPQGYENVREAFADHANDAMIDNIVNHFVVGDDGPATVVATGDFTPAVLFDTVDTHALEVATVVAPVDDAAVALAAAQA